jgi:asparagine synthase (glutamine-hydrolysing)
MCGIAGFIDFNKTSNQEVLTKMTDTLEHRGPDDKGYHVWNTENAVIGFGHRRLSIIDLSPLGHQPMFSKNGRWSIIFNGEVYNYKEIQTELISLGYQFASNSDTEVIMNALDCWGEQAVHKFIGMFAFVLYDLHHQQIHVYRDRAGVKPVYYYWKNNVFLFASELKAFHQHPHFQKEIDMNAVALYFAYTYIPAPHTIFKDTYKLMPGHFMVIDLKTQKITTKKYWDVYDAYAKPALKISKEEAKEETKKLLKSACEYRMVADVPVGVFLSGGYDSSIVTALLQQDRTDKIKTFTIGYEDEHLNEAHYAKDVATLLGTDHTEYYCPLKDAVDILLTQPFYYDEPFWDSSAIPTTIVSKLARQSVTVALSADGGDEIFAGYYRYDFMMKQQRYLKYIPNSLSTLSANILSWFNPENIPFTKNIYNFNSRYPKVISLLQNNSPIKAYKSFITYTSQEDIVALLEKPFTFPTTVMDELPLCGQKGDVIQPLMALDYKTYMVDDILTKVDRATMSTSLEGREPLLDHRLVEFAAQLPSSFKCQEGIKKILLKDITHEYLPEKLMDRPKKGFAAPIKSWFKEEQGRDLLKYYLDPRKIEQQGILNKTKVSNLLNTFLADKPVDFNQVWLLLMFQMWYEKWMN